MELLHMNGTLKMDRIVFTISDLGQFYVLCFISGFFCKG